MPSWNPTTDPPPRRIGGLLAGAVLFLGGMNVLQTIQTPGPQPEGLASDGIHLWLSDFQTNKIYRIDPDVPDSIRAYDAPGTGPEGLAWDGSHLWTGSWFTKKIYRLAVTDTELVVTREFDTPMGAKPVGFTWDGTALWITTWNPFYLFRLDPADGSVLFSRLLGFPAEPLYPNFGSPAPEDLAWDGTLWMTDWYTREIHQFDAETLELLQSIETPGPRSVGLTFHEGFLWNGDTERDAIYKLDVTVSGAPVSWGALKLGNWEPGR